MTNITPYDSMSREQLKDALGMAPPVKVLPQYIIKRNHNTDDRFPSKNIITYQENEIVNLGASIEFVPIMVTKRLVAPATDKLKDKSIDGLYSSEFMYSNEPISTFVFENGEKIERHFQNSYEAKKAHPELKTEGLLYMWVKGLNQIKRLSVKSTSWETFIELQNKIQELDKVWFEVVAELSFEKISKDKVEVDADGKKTTSKIEFYQMKMKVLNDAPPANSFAKLASCAQELTRLIRDGDFYGFAKTDPIIVSLDEKPEVAEPKKTKEIKGEDSSLPDDLDELFNAE